MNMRHSENSRLNELAYDRGNVVLTGLPEIFAIESTNHCNIKCVMCPRGEPDLMRREVGHMPIDTLERIIDQSEFFTEPTWLHWFGEPLMNPAIFKQIEIAKRKVPNPGHIHKRHATWPPRASEYSGFSA